MSNKSSDQFLQLTKKVENLEKRLIKIEQNSNTKENKSNCKITSFLEKKFIRKSSIIAFFISIPTFVGFILSDFGVPPFDFIDEDFWGLLAGLLFWGGIIGFITSFFLPKINQIKAKESSLNNLISNNETEILANKKAYFETKKEVKENFEVRFGKNILPKIGMAFIAIGGLFFMRWSFENGLIGPLGRILLGLISGIVFIFLGDYLSNKYKKYSFILMGGGLCLLYTSTFLARFIYQNEINLPSQIAFLFLLFVTVSSVFLALRHNAQVLGFFALGGGFATPFLANSGSENIVAFLSYILILDIGVLFLSIFKKWPALNFTSFLATFLLSAGTFLQLSFLEGAFFLGAFFLLFLLFSVVSLLGKKENFSPLMLAFSVLTPVFYYGQMLAFLDHHHLNHYKGLFTLMLAALYVFIGTIAFSKRKDDNRILQTFFSSSIVLITIAVFLQAQGIWRVLLWTAEGGVLFYLAEKNNFSSLRFLSLAIITTALINFFTIDFIKHYPQIIINDRFINGIFIVVVCSLLQWKFKQNFSTKFFLTIIFVLPFLIGFAEINNFFDVKKIILYKEKYSYDQLQKIIMFHGLLNSIWILFYAVSLFLGGVYKKITSLRKAALFLFIFAISKALLYDIAELEDGYRITSFILLGFVLLGVAFWYQKNKDLQIK